MRTLYNENFYDIKGVASNSAFAFIFFYFIILFYYTKEEVNVNYLIISGVLYVGLIYFLRKNWDVFQSLFKTFFLKKENFYSKDFIFDYLDNINTKYFTEVVVGNKTKKSNDKKVDSKKENVVAKTTNEIKKNEVKKDTKIIDKNNKVVQKEKVPLFSKQGIKNLLNIQ